MGVGVSYVYPWITSIVAFQGTVGKLLGIGLAAGIGASIYFTLTWVLRVHEFVIVLAYLRTWIAAVRSSAKTG
jgi:hypothetical protein